MIAKNKKEKILNLLIIINYYFKSQIYKLKYYFIYTLLNLIIKLI